MYKSAASISVLTKNGKTRLLCAFCIIYHLLGHRLAVTGKTLYTDTLALTFQLWKNLQFMVLRCI